MIKPRLGDNPLANTGRETEDKENKSAIDKLISGEVVKKVKKKYVTFSFTEELVKEIREYAYWNRIKLSEVAAIAIKKFLKNNPYKKK